MADETRKTWARVVWTPGDVQSIQPDLTDAEAEAFLDNNEKHIRDRLIELGHDVIRDLLDFDDAEDEEGDDDDEEAGEEEAGEEEAGAEG